MRGLPAAGGADEGAARGSEAHTATSAFSNSADVRPVRTPARAPCTRLTPWRGAAAAVQTVRPCGVRQGARARQGPHALAVAGWAQSQHRGSAFGLRDAWPRRRTRCTPVMCPVRRGAPGRDACARCVRALRGAWGLGAVCRGRRGGFPLFPPKRAVPRAWCCPTRPRRTGAGAGAPRAWRLPQSAV